MIGQTVGNFRVVAKLGQGGMGEVFLAEQVSIHTRVAIKTLLPHVSANTDLVQRFFNEAVAVSRIKHSGIAKIFDVGFLDSGQAYLVMEFLEGETLTARIQRSHRMSLGKLCEVGRQIASVLDATIQAGITHRDLKPDNIFIVPDNEMADGERVKILDFGIAKLAGTGQTHTSVGSMGTPGYMSPEQWHNSKNVDWRADAYSLGCLAFEMAAGTPPFVATSIAEACTKHLTARPPALRTVVPAMPSELETLLERLLEKEPERRPGSMKEIGQAFARIRDSQPSVVAATLAPGTARAGSTASPSLPATMMEPSAPEVARSAASVPAVTTLGGAARPLSTVAAAPASRLGWIVGGLGAVVAVVVALVLVMLAGGHDRPVVAALRADAAVAVAPAPADASAVVASAPLDAAPAPIVAVVAASIDAGMPADARVAAMAPARPAVAVAPRTIARPDDRAAAPVAAVTDECRDADEVNCLLNNNEGACCAKYKKRGSPRPADESAPPIAHTELPDTLDRDMISTGVFKVISRVVACGDKSAAKGQVKVHVTVAADGSVSAVSVSSSPDAALGSCVAGAVQKATFAKTRSGGSFGYPFVF